MSDEGAEVLASCQSWFIDGTFKAASHTLFKQVVNRNRRFVVIRFVFVYVLSLYVLSSYTFCRYTFCLRIRFVVIHFVVLYVLSLFLDCLHCWPDSHGQGCSVHVCTASQQVQDHLSTPG
jgi:hypothetical protein